jgi:hypothetical protein
VVGTLSRGLAGQRLPGHREAGQSGQRGQHPPAHRLGMDRGGDRGCRPVQVLDAGRAVLAGHGLEPGEVGYPVAERHLDLITNLPHNTG